jgi:hypothetical protein
MAYDSNETRLRRAVQKRRGQRFIVSELMMEVNTHDDVRLRRAGVLSTAEAANMVSRKRMARAVAKMSNNTTIWEAAI